MATSSVSQLIGLVTYQPVTPMVEKVTVTQAATRLLGNRPPTLCCIKTTNIVVMTAAEGHNIHHFPVQGQHS